MSEIKTPEQVAEELNKSIAKFKEQADNAATKDEVTKVTEEFETFKNEQAAKLDKLASTEALKALEDILAKQGETITRMKNGSETPVKSFNDALKAGFESIQDQLKEIKQNGKGDVSFTIKAPVTITTGASANASGVTTPNLYTAQNVNVYQRDNTQRVYMTDFTTNGSTDKAVIPYIDKLPTEGQFAITAEGALKPLTSISFEQRYSTAVKVAGRTKLSEESLDDINFLMSAVNNELVYEHDIAKQADLISFYEDNDTAFVAGALADTTDAPSNYDAIRAVSYFMNIVSVGNHRPNVVFVNPADAYAMGATKEADSKNYIIPAWVAPDGSRVGAMTVVEENDVTAGTFKVADMSKLRVDAYKEFTVRMGYGITGSATAADIKSDLEANLITMIGESRYHRWIYENDKTALVTASFAAVKTAIDSAV
jgi:HK97 family phage major capsid protein